MMSLFYALLLVRVGCCIEDYTFVTKTVAVGENATLMCPREKSLYQETLYWIRLVSGNRPEFLGATFNFEYDVTTKAPHIRAKQINESFILYIIGAKLSDTGLYYCVKVKQLDMVFINGTFLEIRGPESGLTAVIQDPPSDPVRPGDPVSLQCSVLSDADRKTCSSDHRVYWFRTGSDQSHPRLIYAHGNRGDECERSSEEDSVQKCVYSFSNTSDSGTYYCAVATCGQLLFGNGTKLDPEDLQTPNLYLILLFVALITSLAVISCLIYAIKKGTCACCHDAETNSSKQEIQKRNEPSLIYSAPTFTKKKARKAKRKNEKSSPQETFYTDVKTVHME